MEASRLWRVPCPICGWSVLDTAVNAFSGVAYAHSGLSRVTYTCPKCGERQSCHLPADQTGVQLLSVLAALGQPVVIMAAPPEQSPLPALEIDDLIDMHRDMDAIIEHLLETP